jgi:thioredoxin-related protein
MSKNEFTNAELGNYFNEHFINVKLDMEKGVGPDLAMKFALDSYPTLYFVDCTGKVVSTNVGYHTATDLLALGKIYFDQAPSECE